MEKIAIAIKTMNREPRGGKNYLRETLENLQRGGVFDSPLLESMTIVDGGSSRVMEFLTHELQWLDYPGMIIKFAAEGARTLHQTAQEAISAVAHRPAKWCMVIEDDIDVCADFLGSVVRWLEEHVRDDRRMYVFGANYEQIVRAAERGETEWPYPITAFYGAQCVAWEKRDALHLADWLGPDPHYNGVRNHGHDLLLQRWGLAVGVKHFSASAPSFVQHIGRQSGINNKFFQFESWPGREWSYVGKVTA